MGLQASRAGFVARGFDRRDALVQLFLSPAPRCLVEKGRCRPGLEARPEQRCGRRAGDMPVTTGLRANLGPRVVCHCFPCLLLPSPGGTVLGTEGSAAAALPMLDGDSTAGQGAAPQLCGFGDVAGGAAWGLLSSFPQLRFILALSLCFLFVSIQTSSVTFSSFPPPFVPLCACPNPSTAPSSFQPAAPSPPLGFLGATSSSSNCHLNHFPKTDVTCKEFIEGLGRQDRTCPHLLRAQVSNPSAALLLM